MFIKEVVDSRKIFVLLLNNFGNYVLQKALSIASTCSKIILINVILEQLTQLDDKKLIVKWKHICDLTMSNIINEANRLEGGINNITG